GDKEIVMSKEGWLWSRSGCEGLGGASTIFQEKDWMVKERVCH
nr:hypothetical protein [Tanacetum cinerariifolium]